MRRVLLTLVPAFVLALCLYAVELPLFIESPGGARSVIPLIDIDGTPTYDSDGRLLLTTVNVGRANAFDALRAWIDPNALVLPERLFVSPGQTDRDYERASFSLMDQSKIAAVAVALERLTGYPEEHGAGVIVQDVVVGTPAAGRLLPGDLITHVNGRAIDGLDALRERLSAAGVGGDVRLRVRPLEGGEEELVDLRPITDAESGDAIIGIVAVANFPFEVRIDSGDIGGPSAGLMWALGVTDLLLPEDLTGSDAVAGTGTVDLAGHVGAIGGIRLKIAAAEAAGATTFILPQDNFAEARGAGDDIQLVPVSNVGQAVGFLEEAA